MATVTVSNVTQLMNAINNASGTTTIKLAPGDYDNLYLSGNKIPELSNNNTITFTSLDPNKPASITSMILIGADNVVFDGLNFDYTAAKGAGVSLRPFMLLSSDNITVKNSVFEGDIAKGVAANVDGFGSGIALGLKGTSNATIVDNTFTGFHKAVVATNGVNFDVSRNDISKMSSDGVNFSSAKNVKIMDNHFHNFESPANTTAHKDMIQIWAKGNDEATSNVTISGNFINSAGGTYTQSILITADNGKTHSDFVIKDNLIHNSHTHGTTLNNMKNVVVANNTVLHNVDASLDSSGLWVPKIHIGGQMKNTVVKDNVAHAISGNNWSGSGNLIVQNTNPGQANYYGDLFVNGLAGGNATAADFTVLPGSIIDTTNVGASISQPGGNANALTNVGAGASSGGSANGQASALLLSKEGTELSKGTVDFDISNISGGNTNGAKVVWDYGDGNTGTGLTSSHHYAHAGSYTVKATVTLKDGTKISSQKKLNVDTPIALSTDFENGPIDQADPANKVTTNGSVQFVNDQGSKVAKLGANGMITYAHSPDLVDNTAYTILADFRKDNLSDTGKLISFSNSFVVQIRKDGINASVSTNKGTKWINTKADMDDTSWHTLALTFSGSDGVAELYLDGKSIGSVSGFKGAVQVGNVAHDFHVGSHTGGSFTGLVDNVSFLTGDLSAKDIADLDAGKTTVPDLLGSVINTGGNSGTFQAQAQAPANATVVDTSTPAVVDTSASQAPVQTPAPAKTVSTPTVTNTATTKSVANTDETAISVDFQSGYKDASAVSNKATVKGGVKIINDQGSKVAQLKDKSYITYKDTPDLYNNKAYTVLVDFRKDQASDDGKLISFGQSFNIQIKKTGIAVSVITDKGTKWISTKADVNDTNWHKLALTFDSNAGKAVLYLDGKAIGTAFGLKGATQVGNKSQDFHVGSPSGNSFDGRVDNVTFLTNDLSPAEIKSVHSGAATASSFAGSTTTQTAPASVTVVDTSAPTVVDTSTAQAPVQTTAPAKTVSTPTVTTKSTTNTDETAISVDFQSGFKDGSAVSNTASTKGWVKIVNDKGSKVAQLNDKSHITYKDTPDLYDNKAYTVMVDFRKDHVSDEGKLIHFGHSFSIQVKKTGIAVSVVTDKGTKWISTKADVNDTDWHKLALTFDSDAGKAVLYLDGKAIGTAFGLKGATQVGNTSHDFHVGSPWGKSFDGRVDNVTFLTDNLSAAEIKSVHSGAATASSFAGSTATNTGASNTAPTVTAVPVVDPVDTGNAGNAGGSFSYTMVARNTKVSLSNDKAGIIDQAYLSGATSSSFDVKVIDTASSGYFNNALGAYEIDSKGRIVDVRILDKDAQTGEGTIRITDVEKGNDLGFFIVQNGYNRLDNALGGNNLSLKVENGDIVLKSGKVTLSEKVFISHDKSLNYDNFQHVSSMDNPNTNGAIIAFEDQHKGGRTNDMNDVVFEVTAVGADHLDFA